jgi:protein-L-isoaspartate(D-aspartate) O-methyltransferase
LIKVHKTKDGLEYSELRPVRFVPLLEGLGKDS